MVTRQSVLRPGAVTALATPVDDRGRLDRAALERLVAHCLGGGVVGLSSCGSTGEGARLSRQERVEVARTVAGLAPPEVMLLPGLPLSSLTDAVAELDELAEAGVTAALVAPPSYYPIDGPELVRLYGRLAEHSPVPLLLYNMPRFTTPFPVAAAAELARHPGVVGMKDSSRDMEYLQAVLAATDRSTFTVYTGTDTLLVPSRLMGAGGAITAGANLVPRLVGDVLAATDHDLPRAWELQRTLAEVVETCRAGAFPAGWKAALALAGLCAASMVPPAAALPDDLVEVLRSRLARTGPLTPASSPPGAP